MVAVHEIVDMPENAKSVFKQFEQLVSSQSFSLLDELDEKLRSFDLWIVWDDEMFPIKVWDVQVSESGISFRLDPSAPQ